jgi:lipoate-protein ligase B
MDCEPREQAGWLLDLGRADYLQVLELQRTLVHRRQRGTVPDILLLVEHDPVITMGRRASYQNVLASSRELAAEGIALCHAERGGNVTYHGPGQLVGYPIIHLSRRKLGVRAFVHLLEETIIRTLSEFNLPAGRDPLHRGVWVDRRKVAALGVAIRHWVSFHGFALNISPNLDHFRCINPCGLDSGVVTSMAELLAEPPSMEEVKNVVSARFLQLFPGLWQEASLNQSAESEERFVCEVDYSQ